MSGRENFIFNLTATFHEEGSFYLIHLSSDAVGLLFYCEPRAGLQAQDSGQSFRNNTYDR